MSPDLCRNRRVSRHQATPASITERSERGELTLRWVKATYVPGRISPAMSAIERFKTWRRVA